MLARNLPVLAFGLVLVACASPTSSDAVSSDSAYTSDTSKGPDVRTYTDADKPFDYGARVRVSFDSAPPDEIEAVASVDSFHPNEAMPFMLGIGGHAGGAYYVAFGPAGGKLEVGTYSCADGDAVVFEAEWNPDGTAKPSKAASTCTLIIDELKPGPSSGYVRAYGRFQGAKAAGGLPSDVAGAFLADIPLPIANP